MSSPADRSFAPDLVGRVDELVRTAGDRLAGSSDRLGRTLKYAREVYVRAFVGAVALRNRWRYRAPPEPDRLLMVDPARIGRVSEFALPKFRLSGVVRCGDWDRTARSFEDLDVYRAFEAHFEDGVDWSETAFFDRVLDDIDRGASPWGCRTRAALEERCRRLDRLYESIAADGYLTQAAIDASDRENPLFDPRKPASKRHRDEIAVHIDRSGELLFEDGRNRLTIAKLLDIDAIPVRVLLRHCEWQATREAYVRGEIEPTDAVADHPDLRALSVDRA